MKQRLNSKAWNFIALALFCIGIALIVYPKWVQYVEDQRQLQLLTEWDALPKESWQEEAPQRGSTKSNTNRVSAQETEAEPLVYIDGIPVYGTIIIDKIELREPMLEGATEESLKHGSGIVVPGRYPGEVGNFVLASHRSWTFGRHYNRLDELEVGDEIKLETLQQTYVYKVDSKFVVEPDDLSVLDQSEETRELTLITCEPIRKATHRLIVKASMEGGDT